MTNKSQINATSTIRNYSAEMHNDGLYFLEQAHAATDDFVKRRFLRSSIIYFCSSVEAAMSQIVYKKLNQSEFEQGHPYVELKEKLGDPNAVPPGFSKIKEKISVIEDLYNSRVPRAIKDEYIKLTYLRNKIIHYSNSNKDELYNTGEVENAARRAPETVEKILTVLFSYVNLPDGFEKNRSSYY